MNTLFRRSLWKGYSLELDTFFDSDRLFSQLGDFGWVGQINGNRLPCRQRRREEFEGHHSDLQYASVLPKRNSHGPHPLSVH
jgi:hypothetical protein